MKNEIQINKGHSIDVIISSLQYSNNQFTLDNEVLPSLFISLHFIQFFSTKLHIFSFSPKIQSKVGLKMIHFLVNTLSPINKNLSFIPYPLLLILKNNALFSHSKVLKIKHFHFWGEQIEIPPLQNSTFLYGSNFVLLDNCCLNQLDYWSQGLCNLHHKYPE